MPDRPSSRDQAESILVHSIDRSTAAAAALWAIGSAQYPMSNPILCNQAINAMTEALTTFAVNCRRALQGLNRPFSIRTAGPWNWKPEAEAEVATAFVVDFRDALNRIVHADRLVVVLVPLPPSLARIADGPSLAFPAVEVRTDHKPLAFVDYFGLASTYFSDVVTHLMPRASAT
jgi:hypothetical protein